MSHSHERRQYDDAGSALDGVERPHELIAGFRGAWGFLQNQEALVQIVDPLLEFQAEQLKG